MRLVSPQGIITVEGGNWTLRLIEMWRNHIEMWVCKLKKTNQVGRKTLQLIPLISPTTQVAILPLVLQNYLVRRIIQPNISNHRCVTSKKEIKILLLINRNYQNGTLGWFTLYSNTLNDYLGLGLSTLKVVLTMFTIHSHVFSMRVWNRSYMYWLK